MDTPTADSTNIADSSDTRTGFLDLSAELRNEIYELAITELALDHTSAVDFHEIKVPALCQVNRQIRNEVLPMVHHLWTTSPVTEAWLCFNLSTPVLRRSLLKWLPVVGPVILPHVGGFIIRLDNEKGLADGMRIDFGVYWNPCEYWPVKPSRGIGCMMSIKGKTRAVSLHSRLETVEGSKVAGDVLKLVEGLVQNCEPRRLTVQGMEAVMRKTVSGLSCGTVEF